MLISISLVRLAALVRTVVKDVLPVSMIRAVVLVWTICVRPAHVGVTAINVSQERQVRLVNALMGTSSSMSLVSSAIAAAQPALMVLTRTVQAVKTGTSCSHLAILSVSIAVQLASLNPDQLSTNVLEHQQTSSV